jgi:hypothetical protein
LKYFLVGCISSVILDGKKVRINDKVVEWEDMRKKISCYLEYKIDKKMIIH